MRASPAIAALGPVGKLECYDAFAQPLRRARAAARRNEHGPHGIHAGAHISRRPAAGHPRRRRLSALSAHGRLSAMVAAARRKPRRFSKPWEPVWATRRTEQRRVPPPPQALPEGNAAGHGLCLLRLPQRGRCAAGRLHAFQCAPRRHAMLRARLLDRRALRAPGLYVRCGARADPVHLLHARAAPHRGGVPAVERAVEEPADQGRIPPGRPCAALSADQRRLAGSCPVRFARGRSAG